MNTKGTDIRDPSSTTQKSQKVALAVEQPKPEAAKKGKS
jgi:hypothetical protein